LPDGHRFPMDKYELLPQQLILEGTVEEDQFFSPGFLTDDIILLTHSTDYLDKLKNLTLSKKEIRSIGFPVRSDLIHRGRCIAQGTIDCARYAFDYGVALNIAGGTHHAYSDRGEGFCIFNDFAIASNYLLHERLLEKILIIDLDVHQGNGTAAIFQDEPRVFTLSFHGKNNYPLRKEQSDLDVALEDHCKDETYLQAMDHHIPQIIKQENPELIFYLSGVDILAVDKLGRLSLSIEGAKERDRKIFQWAKDFNTPIAVSMGGGYAPDIATIIEAHANTFRMAAEIFSY